MARWAGLWGSILGGWALQALAQAPAAPSPAATPDEAQLTPARAMVMLDHQVLRVPGDEDIDLTGFHVYHQVNDWLSLGAGVYAPLLKGQYGGFTAFDVGAHLQQRLTDRIFVTAGLAGGGGGGGRSIEQSKVLSGTGGFYKAYAGLGYDFGPVAVGVNLAKMKFTHSAIDSTQANVFLEIPYSYLVAPFSRHGQGLSATDARLAAEDSGENMLTLVLDNFKQIRPEGAFKGTLGVADLQYAHFVAPDTYWYAGLGVGYYGLPLYNQVLGGVGQRLRVAPRVNLYAQLGVGSGGYAPEKINTDSGLLVYPKVSAEYALTPTLGLSLSAGYLAAPKGSSRNVTYGLALTHHLRSGAAAAGWGDAGAASHYQAFRVSLFQQTEFHVRYRDQDRGHLQMVGTQVDAMLDERWFIPVQAAVAYSAYLGYPGYGELLAGLGLQTRAAPGERLQAFGQLMAGTNVHGPAVKASAGLRYALSDRLALNLNAGRTEARSSSGQRFGATSLGLGVDYLFAVPVR